MVLAVGLQNDNVRDIETSDVEFILFGFDRVLFVRDRGSGYVNELG